MSNTHPGGICESLTEIMMCLPLAEMEDIQKL